MITKNNEGQVLIFDWGQIEWLISGAQGNSQTMTFGRVTIKAGHANPRHQHPNCDEILHLLSGTIEHSLRDEKFIMQAGDSISIPTGVFHNARTISVEDAVMLIAFSSPDRQTVSES